MMASILTIFRNQRTLPLWERYRRNTFSWFMSDYTLDNR